MWGFAIVPDTLSYVQWTIPSLLYQTRRKKPLVYKGLMFLLRATENCPTRVSCVKKINCYGRKMMKQKFPDSLSDGHMTTLGSAVAQCEMLLDDKPDN